MKKYILIFSLLLASCTDNTRAKYYGGTAEVELPKDKKLISATWKDEQLWYLYTERSPSEAPKQSVLHEQSKFGLVEGKVVFIEK